MFLIKTKYRGVLKVNDCLVYEAAQKHQLLSSLERNLWAQ